MKSTRIELLRFVLSGGVNTLLTYALYLVLLNVWPYTLAYTVTYLIGIYTSYYLNCVVVFRSEPKWRTALEYPVVYLFQYLLGVLLLYVLVDLLGLNNKVAPLVVIVLSIPMTFWMSRRIIRSRTNQE